MRRHEALQWASFFTLAFALILGHWYMEEARISHVQVLVCWFGHWVGAVALEGFCMRRQGNYKFSTCSVNNRWKLVQNPNSLASLPSAGRWQPQTATYPTYVFKYCTLHLLINPIRAFTWSAVIWNSSTVYMSPLEMSFWNRTQKSTSGCTSR